MNNFLVVGTQRTGSSAIAESLGFHSKIVCGWEWTQDTLWHKKLAVADLAFSGDFRNLDKNNREHMNREFDPQAKWLGFRRLFRASNKWILHPRFAPALWVDRLEAHLQWLGQQDKVHIIHVVRADNLAWLRSKFMAKLMNAHVGKKYPKDIKINITLRDAVARTRCKQWVDYRLASLSHTNPYICIYYEDYLSNENLIMTQALNFLGCDNNLPTREHKVTRQSVSMVSDQLLNYDELKSALMQHDLLDGRQSLPQQKIQIAVEQSNEFNNKEIAEKQKIAAPPKQESTLG